METYRESGPELAEAISAMDETEIYQFIRRQSRSGGLSRTVRRLNRDALSKDLKRRMSAEAAIRKLGFI